MTVIQIPKVQTVEAEVFYDSQLQVALAALEKSKKKPLFMPELADARIASPKESQIWQDWYSAPSTRVTGKNLSGESFVIYAHVPTTLATAKGIEAALPGRKNGAGAMSQKEFLKLLDIADDQRVFVVSYDALKKASNGVISVDKALEHPQTIPFLGGKERAEKYLARHKEVYGKNIGIWHSDNLDETTPRGRLLFLGNYYYNYIIGDGNLLSYGRFLGVSRKVAEGDAQKIKAPTLEQTLRLTKDYVAPINQADLKTRLTGLYK